MKIKLLFTLFATFLVVVLLASSESTYAKEKDTTPQHSKLEKTKHKNILYDKELDAYFDTRENGYIDDVVYEVSGGKIVREIPVEEYLEIEEVDVEEIKTTTSVPESTGTDTITPNAVYESYIYEEESNVLTRIYGDRVSIVQENPGPGDDTFTLAYSASYSSEFNISVNSAITTAIAAGVSYTFNRSAGISSEHSMTIQEGYYGYWRFDPKVRKSQGTLAKLRDGFRVSEQFLRTYYPVKKNGDLDGYLVPVKGKLPAPINI